MSGVDVAVVGGGVIGLAIAWRCAQRGLRVRVYEPTPGGGASHAAAGMLAPVGESTFGERALTELLVSSARRWPGFAGELSAATGMDLGYRDEGTLTVALTSDDLVEAERLWSYQMGLGFGVGVLRARALREVEPALTPRVRGGALVAEDHQVDPRRVVLALRSVLDSLGVPTVGEQSKGSDVDAGITVIAAGCGTSALTGIPVRAVKGQILRLRGAAGLLTRVIRGYADGRHVYLVPRADGEVVVGATMEERMDRTVTVGGVLELLDSAVALVPDLREFELVEALAAHRPATPDNAPVIGVHRPGVVVAAGHFRHGVLLAPITADLVADLIVTGRADPMLASFAPGRFECGEAAS